MPQDPSTALNPALRIERQILEVLEAHDFGGSAAARRDRVQEVMSEVLLPSTPEFLRRYPHQLSGGQQQRVGLAMAFACRPSVIVLDEPTTGLDVTTQAHVLATVRDLCSSHGVAALYVTHDLAVVANWPTASPSCTPAGSSSRGRRRSCSPTRPTRTPGTSSRRCRTWPASGRSSGSPAAPRRPVSGRWVRVRAAVRGRHRRVPRGVPAVALVGRRPQRALLPPVRRRGRRARHEQHGATVSCRRRRGARRSAACRRLQRNRWSTTSISDGAAASASPWSVSRVRARRRCPAPSAGCTTSGPGEILLGGQPLARSARHRAIAERLKIQYVFQNPYSSLNPRRPIGESVARPLVIAKAPAADAKRASARCSSGCR